MIPRFNFGDHIKVKIDTYYHHGIYVSDDEVIHFCNDGMFSILSRDLEITITNLEEFSQGNEVKAVYHKKRFSPEKTVNIARSKIGEKDYDLFFNNCEHFANFCTTGENRSEIIERLKKQYIRVKSKTGMQAMLQNLNNIFEKNENKGVS